MYYFVEMICACARPTDYARCTLRRGFHFVLRRQFGCVFYGVLGFVLYGRQNDAKRGKAFFFLKYVLEDLGKTFDNKTELNGESYSTNISNYIKLNKQIMGRASHRFYLSVREVISARQEIV